MPPDTLWQGLYPVPSQTSPTRCVGGSRFLCVAQGFGQSDQSSSTHFLRVPLQYFSQVYVYVYLTKLNYDSWL